MNDVNSFEVLQVIGDLQKRGITDYQIRPGNDCIWVCERKGGNWFDYYYIFRDGQIVDVQID